MLEKMRISFVSDGMDDAFPYVSIYNPKEMPVSLFHQLGRFGLAIDRKSVFTGKLNSSRKDFVAVIQSYGVELQVVPSV